jgi:hypothetical protein
MATSREHYEQMFKECFPHAKPIAKRGMSLSGIKRTPKNVAYKKGK